MLIHQCINNLSFISYLMIKNFNLLSTFLVGLLRLRHPSIDEFQEQRRFCQFHPRKLYLNYFCVILNSKLYNINNIYELLSTLSYLYKCLIKCIDLQIILI